MEKVTPEKAAEMLLAGGMEVTDKDAEQLLVLLRMLAAIAVSQFLRGHIKK